MPLPERLTATCREAAVWLIGSILAALVFPIPRLDSIPASDFVKLLAEFNRAVELLVASPVALPPGAPQLHKSERILDRLWAAEIAEPNPHFRDDIRIAWITVLNASRGHSEPDVAASYAVLGLHPEKVWPAMEARRHAQLGEEYYKFFGGAVPSPKKPVQSVRAVRRREDSGSRGLSGRAA